MVLEARCGASQGGYKSSKKVDVGITASTFNFAKHQKSRGDTMKQIWFIASIKHQSIAFWVLTL